MTLDVAVIGAGVGGLGAAVILKQAGHRVKVYEKSAFATDIGAALAITPNGAKVLERIGFSVPRARGQYMRYWDIADGVGLKVLSSQDVSSGTFISVHRVDFHKELLRLAQETNPGEKGSVEIKLSSEVTGIDPNAGTVQLKDGTRHTADMIVGADGIHSIARKAVLNGAPCEPSATEYSAFRMLIPTARVTELGTLTELMDWKTQGVTILTDPGSKDRERHLVWYSCQEFVHEQSMTVEHALTVDSDEMQNVVGVHPFEPNQAAESNQKAALLHEYEHFHPDVVKFLELAEEVSEWPLSYYDPFPRWILGRVVVIGDAAHPMMPFGGQAGNQALEDAAALGLCFDSTTTAEDVGARLQLFEKCRKTRATMIQIVSSARAGHEMDVEEKLRQHAEAGDMDIPNTFPKRVKHAFGYDVYEACQAML